MMKQGTTKETMVNSISYWHLAAFLVLLPFDFFYSQLVLASYAIHTLIHLEKERLRLLFTKEVLILTGIYLLGLLAISYSNDRQEGFAITGRQTAMLLLPLLFVLNRLDPATCMTSLLRVFTVTCTGVILYLYIVAFTDINHSHKQVSAIFSSLYINQNFSAPIQLHATYLSMYVALSAASCIYFLLSAGAAWKRIAYGIITAVLLAGLVQLSSRAVVIAFLLILNIVFPVFVLKGKQRLVFFIAALLLSVASVFVVTKVHTFKVRYIGALKEDLTQVAVNNELLEPRVVRWKLALQLVKHSPVTGYGNGSEKSLLRQQYYDNQLYISYLNSFNSHNEYISCLLRFGIPGLLLYLYTLYFGFSLAARSKNFFFLAFLVLVTVVSVSENILDVNKGIFFYSFFFSLFTFSCSSGKFYQRQPSARPQRFDK